MKLRRVEIHKIKKENKYYPFFLDLCIKANNLYNHGNYLIRQKFIETTKLKEEGKLKSAEWIRYNELDKLLKQDKQFPDYYTLPKTILSQSILRLLDRNWKSFFTSIKDWKRHPEKYTGRPKLPKYREKQKPFVLLISEYHSFKLKHNRLKFTKSFNNFELKTKCQKLNNFKSIDQVRILPRKDYLKIEVVYTIDIENKLNKNSNRIISIDLGIDNLATITNNINEKPIIINGKPLKSINHYFNKQRSYLQERAKRCQKKNTTKRLQKLNDKRNNKITDYLHKTSRLIIDYCNHLKIGTIIIGHSKQWKSKVNLGKKNNQTFINIPFNNLIWMIQYKAIQNNINVIIQEESYTSKASYFDNDKIPKLRDKGQRNFSGKRIKRGLYRCKDGSFVNADVNGSLNIMRKATNDVVKPVGKGFVTNPLKITLNNTKFPNLKEFKQ